MKVFVGGSISITQLDCIVKDKLKELIDSQAEILVGDAYGVDSLVQRYCFEQGYRKVTVYTSNSYPRNNVGNFNIKCIIPQKGIFGRAFYTQKDIAMSDDCDCAFMIWDGYSIGTLENITRLLKLGKGVDVYSTEQQRR